MNKGESMFQLVRRAVLSLKNRGVWPTLARVFRYPFANYLKRKQHQTVFSHQGTEDRFTSIYKTNYWGNEESVSGSGSTLGNTENLRRELPKLLGDWRIHTVFDAPCGDFNWMQHVLKAHPITYVGGDIVRPLVESLNRRYRNDATSFIHVDLIQDNFPKADLMICRDCLFHLSYRDTLAVLENFVRSSIPYLLTTTHTNYENEKKFVNRDVVTGEFRLMDLFASPYHFPNDVAARISDWQPPNPEREMCLWSHDQVEAAVVRLKRELDAHHI